MATAYRKVFVNWTTKLLQAGEQDSSPVTLPEFNKYESVPFHVVIVEPDPVIPNKFNRVDISNLTLKASLNDTLDDAAPLAEQSTWTKDTNENTFSGEFDLNTSNLNTLVGSNTSIQAYFQFTAVDSAGGRRVLYQETVTVTNSVIQPTTTSPDPVVTYYTAAETDGLFLKAVNGAGVQLTMISPSGNYQRIWGVDDAGQPIDQILPYP